MAPPADVAQFKRNLLAKDRKIAELLCQEVKLKGDLHGLVTPLARSTDATLRHCGGCRDFEPHQGGQALLQ